MCSCTHASWARCRISGFSAAGWALKSKSSSVFVRGKGGVADAVARARGVAGEDLGFQQHLEELLVGPALRARGRRGLLQALEHARRLELAQEVGQPLADRRRLGLRAHAQSSA
jgi:hypothetical protein